MLTSKLFRPVAGVFAGLAATLLVACGSGADESGGDVAAPAPQSTAVETETERAAATQRAVISERLPYAEIGEELVYGHFVFPSDMVEPLPAVIMFHEWWGLDDNIRVIAETLAAEGYIVFAVDLFAGKTATSPAGARELVTSVVENPDIAVANVRNAYEFVRDTAGAPRVGVLGWGFGGRWSLETAIEFGDELDAVVVYYGQVSDDEDKLRPMTAPLLAHFGTDDKQISADSIKAFDESLQRLRKNYEIRMYAGMDNSFASLKSNNYDREAADEAWQSTLEFLNLHLSVDESS